MYAVQRALISKLQAGAGSTQEIEAHPERNLAKLLESADPLSLAYLWIAIELNCSMVVFHRREKAEGLIDGLGMLAPRYHTILDISRDSDVNSRINFMKMISKGRSNGMPGILGLPKMLAGRHAHRAGGAMAAVMPDRVIDRSEDSLGLLFGFAKYGVSFIASVGGDFYNRSIVRALRSGRFGIRPSDISAVDVSIMLDGSGICRITEYRWLERAEIKATERDFVPKSVYNISMMQNRQFNRDNAPISKVVEAYAESNFISKGYALKELEKRADFLKRAAMEGGADADLIERYHQIA